LILYYYLYYRILRVVELFNDDIPTFIAMLLMCTLNSFQLVIMWSIILYFKPELDDYRTTPTALIIAISVFTINWFLFEHRNRGMKIYERFKNESTIRRLIGSIFSGLFFLFGLGLLQN